MTYQAKVIDGGKIVLPAKLRRELGISVGDMLEIASEEGRMVVRTYDQVITDIQARLRKYVPVGVSVVDGLIADRKAEAAREDEEARTGLAERGQ